LHRICDPVNEESLVGAKNTLSTIHRRLKRLNKKKNQRKAAKENSLSYEALEIRKVLNAAPVGINDPLFATAINIWLFTS